MAYSWQVDLDQKLLKAEVTFKKPFKEKEGDQALGEDYLENINERPVDGKTMILLYIGFPGYIFTNIDS